MRHRKTSALVRTASRESSASRRAPLAPVSRIAHERELLTLVGHHVDVAARSRGASKRLSGFSYALRKRGRGHVIALTNGALYSDGGALLRDLARATKTDPRARARVVRAVVLFLRVVVEHNVRSSAALSLLFRSSLQSALVDGALVNAIAGKGTDDDTARLTKLDGPSRLNLMSGLQIAATTDADAFAGRSDDDDDPLARVRARHAERARDAVPVETSQGHEPEGTGSTS